MNIKNLPSEIISLIGSFFDIETLINLYGIVNNSFFSELTERINHVRIESQIVKDKSSIFKHYFQNMNKLSITNNFNLAEISNFSVNRLTNLNLIRMYNHLSEYIHLQKLNTLEKLSINCCSITDIGLTYISLLTRLKKLKIMYCSEITDNGFIELKKLTNLVSLNIKGSYLITDHGINNLLFTKLEKLNVSVTQITDIGVKHISINFPRLRHTKN